MSIVRFIKRDNPEAARRFGKEVKSKVRRLALFPLSGRMVPEFSMVTLREVVFREYRIVYRVIPEKKRVEVLTVFHGARDFPF